MCEVRPSGTGFPMWGRVSSRSLSIGHQLRSDNGHLARRVDAQPHLASFESDHRHADIFADEELLHQLPGQDEHDSPPFLCPRRTCFHRAQDVSSRASSTRRAMRLNRTLAHVLGRLAAPLKSLGVLCWTPHEAWPVQAKSVRIRPGDRATRSRLLLDSAQSYGSIRNIGLGDGYAACWLRR